MHDVRPAAVAGMFYSGGAIPPGGGGSRVSRGRARERRAPRRRRSIVPHAGYVYSGPVAASAYARLAPLRGHGDARRAARARASRAGARPRGVPRRVRSPRRSARCRSIAAAVERARSRCRRSSSAMPRMRSSTRSRCSCRSCRRVLGDFALVPFAVGRRHAGRGGRRGARRAVGRRRDADRRQLRPVALPPLRRRRARSTATTADAHPRAVARARPRAGVRRHADQRPAARARAGAGSRRALLDLRNSGDTAGDRARVVGYAAFAFTDDAPTDTDLGDRAARARARRDRAPSSGIARARRRRATTRSRRRARPSSRCGSDGALRGCIGSLEARRPLARGRARERASPRPSATRASRRSSRASSHATTIEVSLLSPSAAARVRRRGATRSRSCGRAIDGVILECRPAARDVPAAGVGAAARARANSSPR